jgi:choline dehydrogenase-like flavoprotein
MGHVLGSIARVKLNAPPRATVVDYERDLDGTYVRRRFSISREAQLERDLPNVVAWLANPNPADARHGNGALSLTYLALRSPLGKLLTSESKRLSLTGVNIPQSTYHDAVRTPISSHLLNVAKDCPSVTRLAAELGTKYFPPHSRRAPSFFARSDENCYPLQYHGEQIPNRLSRIRLAAERDALGMPKLEIDMKFSEQDVDGVLRYHEIWDAYLRLHDRGRLEYAPNDPRTAVWLQLGGGAHQLGTTRMAASDRDGVVDAQLAVHGVSNLFVASSSVFLTSSQANPTFMIVVFALRLADRLKSLLPGL